MKKIEIEVSDKYYEKEAKDLIKNVQKRDISFQKDLKFEIPLEKLLKDRFENIKDVMVFRNSGGFSRHRVEIDGQELKNVLEWIVKNNLYDELLEYRVCDAEYGIWDEIETDGINSLGKLNEILNEVND